MHRAEEKFLPDSTLRPGLADNAASRILATFDHRSQVEKRIVICGSTDDGSSWLGCWHSNDLEETYPVAEYGGSDGVFWTSWVEPSSVHSGGRPRVDLWSLVDTLGLVAGRVFPLDELGYHDMSMIDLASAPGGPDGHFGVLSLVMRTDTSLPLACMICPAGADSSVISSFTTSNCRFTMADIDATNRHGYLAYDDFYADSLQWRLLVARVDCDSVHNDGIFQAYNWWHTDGSHMEYPAVAAHGGKVVIAYQKTAEGQPGNPDVHCAYSPQGDLAALAFVVVANSADAERYPRIQWISGDVYVCTFIKNNGLYAAFSNTAGQSWGGRDPDQRVGLRPERVPGVGRRRDGRSVGQDHLGVPQREQRRHALRGLRAATSDDPHRSGGRGGSVPDDPGGDQCLESGGSHPTGRRDLHRHRESGPRLLRQGDHDSVAKRECGGVRPGCAGQSLVSFRDCTFMTNSSYDGGACMFYEQSTPHMEDCVFLGNTADSDGGAVYFWSTDGEVTMSRFEGNHASAWGGAVMTHQGSPSFAACTFHENAATVAAAMAFDSTLVGTLDACEFTENQATQYGGALYCYDTTLRIEACRFYANTAPNGSGIYSAYGPLTIEASTFAGNQSTGSGTVAAYGAVRDGEEGGLRTSLQLAGCTLTGNTAASNRGAGLDLIGGATATADRTIIASGTGKAVYCASGTSATLTCSDVWGNSQGNWTGCLQGQSGVNGNISSDPKLCGAASPDEPYSLRSDSPCAPANNPQCGQVGAWPVGCLTAEVGETLLLPVRAELGPIVPNPFCAGAWVRFAVPAGSERVQLSIHDVAGRLVRRLAEGMTAPGVHRVLWDGRDESGRAVPGGIYFCRLVSGRERLAERVVLVR